MIGRETRTGVFARTVFNLSTLLAYFAWIATPSRTTPSLESYKETLVGLFRYLLHRGWSGFSFYTGDGINQEGVPWVCQSCRAPTHELNEESVVWSCKFLTTQDEFLLAFYSEGAEGG